MNKTKHFGKAYILLILCLTYIPIVISTIYSFNESKLSTKWSGFSLKWYERLFHDRAMFEALANSILLAVAACLLSVLIAMPAALIFHKKQSGFGKMVEFISNMPVMIPEIILGMAYLSIFSFMRLPFGFVTLLTAHTTFCVPYVYSQLRAGLSRVDTSLVDAAKDLGAGSYRAFMDIILPLLMPAVMSGMLLSFAMSFDDVVISIFVSGAKMTLLPVKVYTKLKTGITPEINALNTIVLIVIMLILFIRGLYLGFINKTNIQKGEE